MPGRNCSVGRIRRRTSVLLLGGATSLLAFLAARRRLPWPPSAASDADRRRRRMSSVDPHAPVDRAVPPPFAFGEMPAEAWNPPPSQPLPPGALPNVLFLGAQKAGSTSLSSWLYNAGVCRPHSFPGEPPYFSKEVHYFDHDDRFNQGVDFYARRFHHCLVSGNTKLIMDATPDYLTYPERIFSTYANAGDGALSKLKLIVVLREPVSRELSLCNHKIANGSILTFERHVDAVLRGKPNWHWASTGRYVDHLRKFLSFVRRDQLLVLSYDELKANPAKVQWRIGQFLGREFPGPLPTLNKLESPNKITTVHPATRRQLEPLFQDKNEELYEFLEMHPGPWMEQRPFPRFA